MAEGEWRGGRGRVEDGERRRTRRMRRREGVEEGETKRGREWGCRRRRRNEEEE